MEGLEERGAALRGVRVPLVPSVSELGVTWSDLVT